MVSRTSCAARSASTFSPSASRAIQASSENGAVTRGFSAIRATFMSIAEADLTGLDETGDRRGGAIVRRRRQREVAFAAQQPGCGVEPDPAGARQIDFGPGVQVGEVLRRAGSAFERFHVRPQLNQIAGNEPRRQTDVPEDLHQQPGAVAAGAGAGSERFFGRLHAGLHANEVADFSLQALIEIDEKIDGVARLARDRPQKFSQQRPRRLRLRRKPQGPRAIPPGNSNGQFSAYGSTKKSNGLITSMSAIKSTSIENSFARSGKTYRASQLPCGSCCQLTKCCAGFTAANSL